MSEGMAGSELITVAETAQRLSRSTEQVRRYLREGRLTGRRIGGQWFIEASALATFQEQRREPTSFLDTVRPAIPGEVDPLASVIGIGRGGGSSINEGKEAYRRTFLWRR
ncbi:MAG TPA: helix-turn-helix domain-containing protein [Thermomicrobiales bacterium]|jgi:excisionase family DNA binding protein|nr:helix-turn-helix domain-containing protein [Thermomicrobiales bacterium]